MARSHARITTSIWADREFTRLTALSQRLYFLLLSQPNLSHAGVLPLTIRRWTLLSGDRDEDAIRAALTELDGHRFIVVDYDTEELLIRSFIRNDGVWKQPKVLAIALEEAEQVASPRLRRAIAVELQRLPVTELPAKTRGEVTKLLQGRAELLLADADSPHPYPLPEAPAYPHADPLPEGGPEGDPEGGPEGGAEGGPHGGLDGGPEGLWGEGNSYGEEISVSPDPVPNPLPLPDPPADPPPAPPTANPEHQPAKGEEGEEETNQRMTELINQVRAIRPEWSTHSIQRALTDPTVAERPWPAIHRAMLTIAHDPETQAPGRIKGDGPWWHHPPTTATPQRPPWCGECDERTRLTEHSGGKVARCPRCHPNAPIHAGATP